MDMYDKDFYTNAVQMMETLQKTLENAVDGLQTALNMIPSKVRAIVERSRWSDVVGNHFKQIVIDDSHARFSHFLTEQEPNLERMVSTAQRSIEDLKDAMQMWYNNVDYQR